MKYNRFPPEGYIQKALFFSFCFFIWPILGLHRSPHIHNPPTGGSIVEVVDIEYDLDTEEECNYCGKSASKSVVLVSWEVIHFCPKHFKKSIFQDHE